jgi:hypothetical protein
VVSTYQMVLRRFGRERLDSMMTTVQVLLGIGAVAGTQLLPRLMGSADEIPTINVNIWWAFFIPPVWFAAIDDALAGSGSATSWLLALGGLMATACVMWLAFVRLAHSYEGGLQMLAEERETRPRAARRRWIEALVALPPLSWWLRDSVSRATFLLVGAYLVRDRETRLRVYPGLAPMLVLPFVSFVGALGSDGADARAGAALLSTTYLATIPVLCSGLLQQSQQWQAADIFRAAPIGEPGRIFHGTRRAILAILVFPALALLALLVLAVGAEAADLVLFLPGVISLPVWAVYVQTRGEKLPFSRPPDAGFGAGYGSKLLATLFLSVLLSVASYVAFSVGFLWFFIAGELAVALPLYVMLRRKVDRAGWGAEDVDELE